MRRLPVFLVVDVSESMVGKPLQEVFDGINKIISNLRTNPMALETAYLSVIVFAGKAKTVLPLTEVLKFVLPPLPIGGGTSLGFAMSFLMDEIDSQVQKTTMEKKGDWKPIVFLLSDGVPTDNIQEALKRWNESYRKKVNMVCIGIGDQSDLKSLSSFTQNVFLLKDTTPKAYSEFFKWISASIETKSINVAMNAEDDFQLDKPNEEFLQKNSAEEKEMRTVDERQAILLCRCQKKKTPFLIKYIKQQNNALHLDSAYIVSEEYFSLSNKEGIGGGVNTEQISAYPVCPVCSSSGYALCVCGHLFCIDKVEKTVCPWCGNKSDVGYSGSFNISTAQG